MPNLTLNIPEENVSLILDAFNAMTEKDSIGIDFNGDIRKGFKINPKDPSENNLVFAKRVSKEILVNFVKLYKYELDNNRYLEEIKLVSKPKENVSINIID